MNQWLKLKPVLTNYIKNKLNYLFYDFMKATVVIRLSGSMLLIVVRVYNLVIYFTDKKGIQ